MGGRERERSYEKKEEKNGMENENILLLFYYFTLVYDRSFFKCAKFNATSGISCCKFVTKKNVWNDSKWISNPFSFVLFWMDWDASEREREREIERRRVWQWKAVKTMFTCSLKMARNIRNHMLFDLKLRKIHIHKRAHTHTHSPVSMYQCE